MKKVLMYLGIFAAFGALFTVLALGYVDSFIYNISQSSSFNASQSSQEKDELKNANIVLDQDMQNLQFSYDNKYYAYMKDQKVYINELKDGKSKFVIEEDLPIVGFELLYDKNMILYFTENKKTNSSVITLNTYEIDTDRKSEYNNYTIQGFVGIKEMNMSPVINIIYINMDIKTGNTVTNTLYKIDLFKTMTRVVSNKKIEKIIMLQHRDRICYEDNQSNIYLGGSRLNIFKEDVDLIGIDADDVLYFLSKETKNKVYKVENYKIKDTIELSDQDVVTTYTNNLGVYIVYPTYVINVASEDPYERIGKISKYVQFEAIKENKMYLRTFNDILIQADIKDHN